MKLRRLNTVLVAAAILISGILPVSGAPSGPPTHHRASSLEYWEQTTYRDFSAGTPDGISVVKCSNGELTSRAIAVRSPVLPGENITCIARGMRDFVYAGTSGGNVLRINSTSGELYNCGLAIAGEQSVTALALGKDGTVWGGTSPSGKLFRADPDSFIISGLGIALAGETRITAMTAGPDGNIWAGTYPNGRVVRITPSSNTFSPFGQAVGGESSVTSLADTGGGKLWGGTAPTGQLFSLDTSSGAYTLRGSADLDAISVPSMLWTSRPELWATSVGATGAGKLILINTAGGNPVQWSGAAVPGERFVNALAEDSYGQLWAGTGNSSRLVQFDPSARTVTRVWAVLSDEENLTALCTAEDGSVWGGTQGSPRIVQVGASRMQRVPEILLGRSRSGRMLYDGFEQLRGGKPAQWTEQNSNGGQWGVQTESGRGNVYVQQDPFALNTFSISGDADWTDYYYESRLRIGQEAATEPNGNGARMGLRDNTTGDRYGVCVYEPQDSIDLYRLGAGYGSIASFPTAVPQNQWFKIRLRVHGYLADVWMDTTRVTPLAGTDIGINYQKGMVGLGARKAAVAFDDACVFRDTMITVANVSAGQRISLHNDTGAQLAAFTANGPVAVIDLSAFSFPLRAYFNITRSDGSTPLYTSPVIPDIFGGDAFHQNLNTPSYQYFPSGTFISSPFDAQYAAPWKKIVWNASVLAPANLSFELRGAALESELATAAWCQMLTASGSDIPIAPSRWLQYRVTMLTGNGKNSPLLSSVNVSYEILPPVIQVIKTVSDDRPMPGQIVNFTISLTNTGNGLASSVRVNDTLMTGMHFLNSSAPTARNGTFWTFTNISPGDTHSFNITAQIDDRLTDGTMLENRAQAISTDRGGAEMEPRLGNVSFLVIAPVLKCTLVPRSPAVGPSGTVVIDVVVNNTGAAGAYNLTMDVTPPFSGVLSGWSGDPVKALNTSWTMPSLAPQEYLCFTMSYSIANLPPGLTLETQMLLGHRDILGRPGVPVRGNCTVITNTGKPDVPDYRLDGKYTGTASPGGSVVMTFSVLNDGINGSLYVNASVANSTGLALRTPNAFNFTDFSPGHRENFAITAQIAPGVSDRDILWANLTVNYTNLTGAPAGYALMGLCITVLAPHITVRKLALSGAATPGNDIIFAVIVTNNGSVPEPDMTVRDIVPGGLTYLSSSLPLENNISWRFRDFRTGTISFFVTFRVNDTVMLGTVITNRITVNGTTGNGNFSDAAFTAAAAPVTDLVAPAILLASPRNGGGEIASDVSITVLFSEPMNRTATERAFTLSPRIPGKLGWEGNRLVYKPSSKLSTLTQYTVRISSQACDIAGNQLPDNFTFTFRTSGLQADLTGVAFGLSSVLLAVVAIETIYVYATYRKRRPGAPPAPVEETAQAPPPPPLPPELGQVPRPPEPVPPAPGKAEPGMPAVEKKPERPGPQKQAPSIKPPGQKATPSPEVRKKNVDPDTDPLAALIGGKGG